MRQFGVSASLVTLAITSSAFAQAAGTSATAADSDTQVSLWTTIQSGGIIGVLIIVMSLVAVSFIIEHFMSIRRERLVPSRLVGELDALLEAKQYQDAQEACYRDGSFLGHVVAAGLDHVGSMFGYFDMQNAMQEVSEREIGRLYRKIEYLSFIGAASPMMGLLGTVIGMIESFNQIALAQGAATPTQLAGGISVALVTTCMGLIVAIPTMFFVSLFRNRIDGYVAEAETVVERLVGRFRHEQA